MARKPIVKEALSLRPGRPTDAEVAGQLLFDSFPQVATFILGLGSADQAIRLLSRIFVTEGHRFSYAVTQLVQYRSRVIGLMTAYAGRDLTRLDWKTSRLVLKGYRLRGKLALIIRAWPMVFMSEASRDEYLIGNLTVKKRYRNQGVGEWMLAHAEEQAREKGLNKVALRVAIENRAAGQFYERHGYRVKSLHLESNKRVPYVGAGYRRMVKELAP